MDQSIASRVATTREQADRWKANLAVSAVREREEMILAQCADRCREAALLLGGDSKPWEERKNAYLEAVTQARWDAVEALS